MATLLAVMAGATPHAQDVAPLLTLDEATRLALAGNAPLASAALDVERVDAQIGAARTRRWPAVDARVNLLGLLTPIDFEFKKGIFGQNPPPLGSVPPTDTLVTTPRGFSGLSVISVAQPISALSRVNLRVAQLEDERLVMAERRRARTLDVTADVKRLYTGIVQAEAAMRTIDEALAMYREIERLVSGHVAEDTALQADLQDARARLADTEYRAVVARNTAASLRDQLNVVAGRDPGTPFSVAPRPEAPPPLADVDALVTRALETRPDLREAELRARQAATDERLARVERRPEVSLQFTDVILGNIAVLPTHIAAIGVGVSWEFLDWGRGRFELAAKQKTRAQADIAVQDARRRIAVDVRQRHRQVMEATALLAASTAAEAAARERLRLATVRQRAEVVLDRDLLAAQAAHAEAAERERRALEALWSAQAELERAMGGA